MQVNLPKKEFLNKMYGLSRELANEVNREKYYFKFITKCEKMLYPLNQERKITDSEYDICGRRQQIQINTKIGTQHYGWSTHTSTFNEKELLEVMKSKRMSRIVNELLQQDSKRELWQGFSQISRQFHDSYRNETYKVEKDPVSFTIDTYDGKYHFCSNECILPAFSTIKFLPYHAKEQDPVKTKTQGEFMLRVLNYYGQLHYDFQRPSMDVNILQILKRLNEHFDLAHVFKAKIAKEKEIIAKNKAVYNNFKNQYMTRLMADAI